MSASSHSLSFPALLAKLRSLLPSDKHAELDAVSESINSAPSDEAAVHSSVVAARHLPHDLATGRPPLRPPPDRLCQVQRRLCEIAGKELVQAAAHQHAHTASQELPPPSLPLPPPELHKARARCAEQPLARCTHRWLGAAARTAQGSRSAAAVPRVLSTRCSSRCTRGARSGTGGEAAPAVLLLWPTLHGAVLQHARRRAPPVRRCSSFSASKTATRLSCRPTSAPRRRRAWRGRRGWRRRGWRVRRG